VVEAACEGPEKTAQDRSHEGHEGQTYRKDCHALRAKGSADNEVVALVVQNPGDREEKTAEGQVFHLPEELPIETEGE